MARREQRSAGWWRAVIKRQVASGLSRKGFCDREGIGRSSFETWRRRLAVEGTTESFVDLTPAGTVSRSWDLELALPGGITLRVRG